MKKAATIKQPLQLQQEYNKIIKGYKSKNKELIQKTSPNWISGERFQIFTMFKDIPSGTPSTESCITL